jgi:hypothetical protein
MFCPRHMQAQPNGPDDFSLHLLHRACNFQNAEGIHDSLRQLYTLLASGAISPRRAAVLGYLTSLLLRTLPAVYNDPLPLAGTLMSAAQLAERDKATPCPLPRPNPPHPPQARNPRQHGSPCLLSSPRLNRSPLRHIRPHWGEPLPIKLSRSLPRNPRPNLPFIPHHQLTHTHRRLPRLRPRPPPTRDPRRIRRASPQIRSLNSTATNSTNLNKTKPSFHQPAAPTPTKREPKQNHN